MATFTVILDADNSDLGSTKDQHEIIFAEGAMVESLHIGAQSLQSLPKDAIEEIEMLFPNLFTPTGGLNPTARQVLKTYEVRALLAA